MGAKIGLRRFDRQLSAIHYTLPNDFFSTSLMKCRATFLSMTGDFSQIMTPQFFPLITRHSLRQTAGDAEAEASRLVLEF